MRTFRNRMDAAAQLSKALTHLKAEHPLILAIPRGAVPMAQRISETLDTDFDVILVRKIGAPGNPEYAIGSVSEFGDVFMTDSATYFDEKYITEQSQIELKSLQRKRREYTPIHPPHSPSGRTVILIDDGIATGSTMLSAVRAVRKKGASRVIVATPVASVGMSANLRDEADDVIALETPWDFQSVSQYYDDFTQVTDEEVRNALRSPPAPHEAA